MLRKLLLACLSVLCVACSPRDSIEASPDHRVAGSIALSLVLNDGSAVTAVAFELRRRAQLVHQGELFFDSAGHASAEVVGLPAAADYRLTVFASRTRDAAALPSCQGVATFEVRAAQTTAVSVMVQCDEESVAGAVTVSGTFNRCPRIDFASATPIVQELGKTLQLRAGGSDVDGDELTFEWFEGAFPGDPSAAFAVGQSASYRCASLGTHWLNLRVGDPNGCAKSLATPLRIDCRAALDLDAGMQDAGDSGTPVLEGDGAILDGAIDQPAPDGSLPCTGFVSCGSSCEDDTITFATCTAGGWRCPPDYPLPSTACPCGMGLPGACPGGQFAQCDPATGRDVCPAVDGGSADAGPQGGPLPPECQPRGVGDTLLFEPLGRPGADGAFAEIVADLSADGTTAIGSAYRRNAQGQHTFLGSFRWSAREGFVLLDTSSPYSIVTAVNADGSVIVGTRDGAARHVGGAWERLHGSPDSYAIDVSDDGTAVLTWDGAQNLLLTATGTRVLPTGAQQISGDGNVVAGYDPPFAQQLFRLPLNGELEHLSRPFLDADNLLAVQDLSWDGSVAVGEVLSSTGSRALLWSADGSFIDLGDAEGPEARSTASAVSADGTVVVGSVQSAPASTPAAAVWTADTGWRSIASLLSAAGADIESFQLLAASAVSADGRTVAGIANCSQVSVGWIARLPDPRTMR